MLESPNTARMKIGWQRILSMAFFVVAAGLFIAMHFLPMSRIGDDGGWMLWIGIWEVIWDLRLIGDSQTTILVTSLLTFSLLIVASPFVGNVWVKSLLAWSVVVIFSGVSTAAFWFIIFTDTSAGHLSSGLRCLMFSPVLNFTGLLLARPQWLKQAGPPFNPESQAVD